MPDEHGSPLSTLRASRILTVSETSKRDILDFFKVPQTEKDEVLAAFAAHKGEVTEGSMATAKA